MAKAEPEEERDSKRQSIWDRLDRLLIIGGPIVPEEDAEEDSRDFRLRPGWTIKS